MEEIDLDKLIEDISCMCSKESTMAGMICGSTYMLKQRHLAHLHLLKGKELEAIYHLTESHGAGMRQHGLVQNVLNQSSGKGEKVQPESKVLRTECLSFDSPYATTTNKLDGMLMRLQELPKEWTLVQLTRKFEPKELFQRRSAETSIQPKGFHITRLPCGSNLQNRECSVSFEIPWPEYDLLRGFWDIRKQLSTRHAAARVIRKIRETAASDTERLLREIGLLCFKEWIVLLLGNLCDIKLQNRIRKSVDSVLNFSPNDSVSDRQRYVAYLLAEGCCHLNEQEFESAVSEIFPDDKTLRIAFFEMLTSLKSEITTELMTAKRHSVILILDEHFDIIPWESMPILKRHPVSRVPSLHFLHALFKEHEPFIKNGLREVANDEICYYVINPDGDLPGVEEKLSIFIKKRLPHWEGLIGKKPTEEQLVEALTTKNTFVYCGHGSGSQYLSSDAIQKLKVKPVQMLYGCSSAALKDHGGTVEMTGDILQYSLAGSGCTLGMLWSVMSNDTDKMTMTLVNTWLPGAPVDINTLELVENDTKPKEPELLRTMKEVRDCVDIVTNGAALIARGIPVVLVSKNAS